MLTQPRQQNLWGAGVAVLLGLLFWPWGHPAPAKVPQPTLQAWQTPALYTQKAIRMALPTGPITVTGAGDASYNTVYNPSGTVNGLTEYVSSSGRLIYADMDRGAVIWYMNTSVQSGSSHNDAYRNINGAADNLPMMGWGVYFGTSPAPTLSYDSGTSTPPATTAPRRRPVMSG